MMMMIIIVFISVIIMIIVIIIIIIIIIMIIIIIISSNSSSSSSNYHCCYCHYYHYPYYYYYYYYYQHYYYYYYYCRGRGSPWRRGGRGPREFHEPGLFPLKRCAVVSLFVRSGLGCRILGRGDGFTSLDVDMFLRRFRADSRLRKSLQYFRAISQWENNSLPKSLQLSAKLPQQLHRPRSKSRLAKFPERTTGSCPACAARKSGWTPPTPASARYTGTQVHRYVGT